MKNAAIRSTTGERRLKDHMPPFGGALAVIRTMIQSSDRLPYSVHYVDNRRIFQHVTTTLSF